MVLPAQAPQLLSLNLDALPQLDNIVASPDAINDDPDPEPRHHRSRTSSTLSSTRSHRTHITANTRQNVIHRLQALLPSSNSTSHAHSSNDLTVTPLTRPPKRIPEPRKFLKIRVITWNMHDSLPKVRQPDVAMSSRTLTYLSLG